MYWNCSVDIIINTSMIVFEHGFMYEIVNVSKKHKILDMSSKMSWISCVQFGPEKHVLMQL